MIKDDLYNDLKDAMKQNNSIKKNTIQLIRAAILQLEKDKQYSMTEDDIQDVLMREKKKRVEALAQFEKANREDLIEQTKKEIFYISKYLPQPMHEDELKKEVSIIITDLNATHKEFGKVMREAKNKFKNRADGKLLNKVVTELLQK